MSIDIESINTNGNTFQVEIDWEQYFRDFCDAHGKYPVLHNDLLLFEDGYMYSSNDYKGPEYAPPDEPLELMKLRRTYYQRRLSIVRAEHKKMEGFITDLTNLQRRLSCPLSQRIMSKDDEGKTIIQAQQLDMRMLDQRLRWLSEDVKMCEGMVKRLGG